MWLVGGGGQDRFLSDVPFPAPNPAIHPGNSWLLLSLELYFPPPRPGVEVRRETGKGQKQ